MHPSTSDVVGFVAEVAVIWSAAMATMRTLRGTGRDVRVLVAAAAATILALVVAAATSRSVVVVYFVAAVASIATAVAEGTRMAVAGRAERHLFAATALVTVAILVSASLISAGLSSPLGRTLPPVGQSASPTAGSLAQVMGATATPVRAAQRATPTSAGNPGPAPAPTPTTAPPAKPTPTATLPPPPKATFSYMWDSTFAYRDDFDASQSTGHALTYAWNFGDGGTGSGEYATHTYPAANAYHVTLTVTDSAGQTSVWATYAHALGPPPQAYFTWQPDPTYQHTIDFDASGSSGDPPLIYMWQLGDGTGDRGTPETHTYQQPGTYTVILTVEDDEERTAQYVQQVTVS